ncbi:MAG: polysaccharide deacetylase family protein [Paracoccaceae bacterium]|nr:polysaccharide deacetylase family protein [Paracoccaceae bacterium]
MTVDLEEAHHAATLSAEWVNKQRRVLATTSRNLDMFNQHSVTATFFVLGTVVEQHPDLICRIFSTGHELASHGWAHHRLSDQPPKEFKTDVSRAKAALEQVP